jgi:hypothetical protein
MKANRYAISLGLAFAFGCHLCASAEEVPKQLLHRREGAVLKGAPFATNPDLSSIWKREERNAGQMLTSREFRPPEKPQLMEFATFKNDIGYADFFVGNGQVDRPSELPPCKSDRLQFAFLIEKGHQ